MKTFCERVSAFCRGRVALTAFIVCALLASAVIVPVMAANGGLFALCGDYSAEEVSFGIAMNEGIKSGALWNSSVDIGSNLLESFGFYNIGSPFFLITLLFPATTFPYLMGWLLILKFAVAGATAALFMKRYLKTAFGTLFGAVLYAFSGFQLISVVFYHFQDVVALFPLMLWALDELLLAGKRHRFGLACLVNALTNPVFFFGSACFTVLYFIIRYLVPAIRKKQFKAFISRVPGCVLEASLGVLAAGILLIPVVMGLLGNDRATALMSLKNGLILKKDMVLYRLQGLFLPAENMNWYSAISEDNWGTWNAFLPLCGSCFAISYVLTERDWLSKKLIVLAAFVLVPILGSIFMALNAQEYGRWFYMLTLIMALASARVFEWPERYRIGIGCLLSALAIGAYFGLTYFMGRHLNNGSGIIHRPAKYFAFIAVALAMLGICLLFKRFSGMPCTKRVFAGLTAVTCVALFTVEVIGYSKSYSDDYNVDFGDSGRGFAETVVTYVTEVPQQLEKDTLPYRYCFDEGIGHAYYDFAMAGSLRSVNSFITTVSNGITTFYTALGQKREYYSPTKPAGVPEVLGGRYTVSLEKPADAEPIAQYTNANGQTFYVTVNENALALGTLYDTYITASEFAGVNEKNRAVVMLKTLVVPDDAAEDVAKVLAHEDAYLELTVADLAAAAASHPKDTTTGFTEGRDTFSCTVTAEKDAYAFFAVPAEKYWHVTVNGAETAFVEINGLMAVPVSAGENSIVFGYRYPPFTYGAATTAAAAALWCVYALATRRRRPEPLAELAEA